MASMIKTSWCYCPSKSWQSRTYSFLPSIRISQITSRVEYVSCKIKLVRHHFQDQNPPHLFPAQHQRTSEVWSLDLKGRYSCFVQSQASDGDLPPVNTCYCCFFSWVFFMFVSPQFLLFVAFSGSSPPPLGCRAAPGKPTWSSARWWRYHHNHHHHHGASQWCFKLIAPHCVLKPVRDNLVVHTIGL